jgi:hypothetical protein
MRAIHQPPFGTKHKIGAIEVLTSRLLVQRLFDALGRCSLGLGILDRRFGQLGNPLSGCDRV